MVMPGAVDACDGVDNDGDLQTDEDGWEILGSPGLLSSDSPPIRVAAAASSTGFFVAYSAYCGGQNTDVFVNHISVNGTVALTSGPCGTTTGLRPLSSPTRASRNPVLAGNGTQTAGLAWTEATATGAEVRITEVNVDPANGSNPLTALATTSAGIIESGNYGAENAYPGMAQAAGGTGYVVGKTEGALANEKAKAYAVARGGAGLTAAASGVELRTSTEGEVALAGLPGNSYVGAWTDATTLYGRWLSPSVTTTSDWIARDLPSQMFPVELQVVAVNADRALVVWQSGAAVAGADTVKMSWLNRGDTVFQPQTPFNAVNTRDRRGFFGTAISARDEVLVAAVSDSNGLLQLHRVNPFVNRTCAPALTLDTRVDAGHASVAVNGNRALVVWRTGGDTGADVNAIRYVLLRRAGT